MKELNRIVNLLLLNSSCLEDIGLFQGKMGVSLFFFHYSRYTNDKLYSEFAELLIDEIYEDIYLCNSVNLEDGLCGIGWGIEYLIQHNFVQGNTNEILYELDQKIMGIDIRRIDDLSFRKGLEGIVYYVLCRLISKKKDQMDEPFDLLFLSDLKNTIINLHRKNIIAVESVVFFTYLQYMENQSFSDFKMEIPLSFCESSLIENKITGMPLGLENGLAGIGLKKILS